MTTIAYVHGEIAADTLCTWGTNRDGYTTKIAKKSCFLAGASGTVGGMQRFLDWFSSGMKGDPPEMPKEPDRQTFGMIITPSDEVLLFGPQGWERTKNHMASMGSGGEFATGAMAMGASAEQAVRIAMQFDTKSGGDITVLRR